MPKEFVRIMLRRLFYVEDQAEERRKDGQPFAHLRLEVQAIRWLLTHAHVEIVRRPGMGLMRNDAGERTMRVRRDVMPPAPARVSVSRETMALATGLYRGGASPEEIAVELRTSPAMVIAALTEAGYSVSQEIERDRR